MGKILLSVIISNNLSVMVFGRSNLGLLDTVLTIVQNQIDHINLIANAKLIIIMTSKFVYQLYKRIFR